TIETFSIVVGSNSVAVTGCSSSSVIVCSFLDAAAGLRDPGDLRGELRRALREELVELLDGDAGLLAERADRRRGARLQIAVAHEVHNEPVTGGQFLDAVSSRNTLGEPTVPLSDV